MVCFCTLPIAKLYISIVITASHLIKSIQSINDDNSIKNLIVFVDIIISSKIRIFDY